MYSNNYGRRPLFDSQDFHEYHAGVVEGLKRQIDGLSLDELQSEKKREAMVAGATRVVPTIDWTKLEITKKEEQTRYSDDRFFGRQAYKVTVCTFEVPFTGDQGMFSISPTQRRLSHDKADVNHDGTLSFELTASEDAEQSKAVLKRMQDNIDTNLNNLRNDIAGHNASLEGVVDDLFDRRIAELDKHASQADSFGVPMRADTE
jgi:hypothetical protein